MATSHYLIQYCAKPIKLYRVSRGIIRPKVVKKHNIVVTFSQIFLLFENDIMWKLYTIKQ